jgi:hypothetical protein
MIIPDNHSVLWLFFGMIWVKRIFRYFFLCFLILGLYENDFMI